MTPTDSTTSALDPSAAAPVVDLLAEPTVEECIREWNQYDEDTKSGRLNEVDIPGGHYFAYFGGRIIDHDTNCAALRERAARKAGVHWARLVIRYCHPGL